MQERQAGITALVTAYARAYHATHDSPKIFDDFAADHLYTLEEHRSFDYNLAASLARFQELDPEFVASNPDQEAALGWIIQTIHGPVTLSRSRYTEDCLEEAVNQGVQQYVILGAGLDTFAFRRTDLLEHLQVLEVDHPVTQALKQERLAIPGWSIPAQLHFVPVDFTKEDLTTALNRSSYDAAQLSFFSWLGVTYYLTREAIFAALESIANLSPAGSTLVFDYMDTDAFIPERVAKRTRLLQDSARQVGEPMKTGFDPQLIGEELAQVEFTVVENLSPADIEARYFQGRTDHYHAFEHVHFARATVE